MVPEQPRDDPFGLVSGRLQAQATVRHLPLHPGLAVHQGVGVQLLVHLLEFFFEVIQELLAVLARPIANGEGSGGLRRQIDGILRHLLALVYPLASLLLLFSVEKLISLFLMRQGMASDIIQRGSNSAFVHLCASAVRTIASSA
jgi:hypothetical protein